MHPRRVVPDKEGLSFLLGLVHEAFGILDQHSCQRSPCCTWPCDLPASSGDQPYWGKAPRVPRPRSSAFQPCPSVASLWGHPHPSPKSELDCEGRFCLSSPGGSRTSTGLTSRQGGTGSRRTHQNHAQWAGICSSRPSGSCRTVR